MKPVVHRIRSLATLAPCVLLFNACAARVPDDGPAHTAAADTLDAVETGEVTVSDTTIAITGARGGSPLVDHIITRLPRASRNK